MGPGKMDQDCGRRSDQRGQNRSRKEIGRGLNRKRGTGRVPVQRTFSGDSPRSCPCCLLEPCRQCMTLVCHVRAEGETCWLTELSGRLTARPGHWDGRGWPGARRGHPCSQVSTGLHLGPATEESRRDCCADEMEDWTSDDLLAPCCTTLRASSPGRLSDEKTERRIDEKNEETTSRQFDCICTCRAAASAP